MAWSTRELAELAGTTVNTVRHYHRLGLLDEPVRMINGYKQYEVRHLVCLLRIRRLVDIGVPLNRIDAVGVRGTTAPEVLRELDAELEASIRRLERARADIAAILSGDAPADIPAGFEAVASRISEADSSMIHLYGRVLDADAMADVRQMVEDDDDDAVAAELDGLAADADDATRQRLAEAIAPTIAQNIVDYPWLRNPEALVAEGRKVSRQTFTEAAQTLYNPAQLDVLVRASLLAYEQLGPPAELPENNA